jgi:hypothetical protein
MHLPGVHELSEPVQLLLSQLHLPLVPERAQ